VTDKPANAVKEVKSGRIEFKMDKFANMHTLIGRLSFSEDALYENGARLIEAILKARPKTLKGSYLKNATLSSSMGPGVRLDLSKFVKEQETAE